MTLMTLGRIIEEKFLEVRWGSGYKTHYQTQVKKRPKRRVCKMTHYLMAVLVTPENIIFLKCAGMAIFSILPEEVFPPLTWMQRALTEEEQLFLGPRTPAEGGVGAGEGTWCSNLEK